MNPELANALSGAATRLKKVEVKDKTKPALLSKEEEAQRLSKYVTNVREADIDTWYVNPAFILTESGTRRWLSSPMRARCFL
jgi:hypothetical protein